MAGVAIAVGWAAAGCTQRTGTHATIVVDAPVALADQPLHLSITDLVPHEQVTLDAHADDHRKRRWRGQATFTADDHGVVDLDAAPATAGSYSGVDGMGCSGR
jgi:hypothetical protein